MRFSRLARLVLLFGLIESLPIPASAQAQAAAMVERDTGPKHLVITYHCQPATRAAFRDYMTGEGVKRFETWKRQGVLNDYRVLFNWFVDEDTWDMLSILSFSQYSDIDKWRQVERVSPGGLTRDGLALCSPRVTYAMDLLWHNNSQSLKSDPAKSVFLMIPYEYYPASSLDEYTKYVSGYVIPQFDSWIRDNILVSYSILVNRFQTSRPWQALFVLEYRDTEAFGEREKEVDKVKAELQKDDAWKSLGDRKLKIRTEKQTATAEELVAR